MPGAWFVRFQSHLLVMLFSDICRTYTYSTSDLGGLLPSTSTPCCNGILGFAAPYGRMPCSEMRCCDSTEIIALQKVNHALGFCFRCVAESLLDRQPSYARRCYRNGESVASTNNTEMEYTLKTCCKDQDLKFAVVTYSDDVALTIKCVRR